jgi:DNA-binding NtrC family response regulator
MESMLAYRWPGNVRELRNCLERAAILTDGELIRPSHLGLRTASADDGDSRGSSDAVTYNLVLPEAELSLDALTERILSITLVRCGGNKSRASQLLKINRKAFYRS